MGGSPSCRIETNKRNPRGSWPAHSCDGRPRLAREVTSLGHQKSCGCQVSAPHWVSGQACKWQEAQEPHSWPRVPGLSEHQEQEGEAGAPSHHWVLTTQLLTQEEPTEGAIAGQEGQAPRGSMHCGEVRTAGEHALEGSTGTSCTKGHVLLGWQTQRLSTRSRLARELSISPNSLGSLSSQGCQGVMPRPGKARHPGPGASPGLNTDCTKAMGYRGQGL